MSSELVDKDTLLMLKDLLGDRFNALLETYLSDSILRLQSLKKALQAQDYEVAKHEVHGLKGSSRNIGVNQLADLCEELEKQTRTGNVVNGEKQFAAIEQNFAAVDETLRCYL